MSLAGASRRLRRHRCLPAALRRSLSDSVPTISVAAAANRRLRRASGGEKQLATSPFHSPITDRSNLDVAVRRLARDRRFDYIRALIDSRRRALPATDAAAAYIIRAYGAAGLADDAMSLFRDLPSPPSVAAFNALLSAFVMAEQHRRVPELFSQISEEFSVVPDSTSYSILIRSHCLSRSTEKALETLDEMEDSGMEVTVPVYTMVLYHLYKERKMEECDGLWKEMLAKGCKPDLSDKILASMEMMEAAELNPDTETYCNSGQYSDGRDAGKGCATSAATFGQMLALEAAAGDLDVAIGAYKGSLMLRKLPDFRVVKALVIRLAEASRAEEAKKLIYRTKAMFPRVFNQGWKKLEKELDPSAAAGTPETAIAA